MHKDIKDFKTQLRGRQLELQNKKTKKTAFISKTTTRTCFTLVCTFLCPFRTTT